MKEVTRKDVLKVVRKAQRSAKKASDDAAHADAVVSVYWKSALRPWLISQDFRESAGLTFSLSQSLIMILESNIDSPKV